MRRLALLALLAAAAVAQPARAAAPPLAGAELGGGSVGAEGEDTLLAVRVGADARTVRFAGALSVPCGRNWRLRRLFAATATIAADGTFDVRLPTRNPSRVFHPGGSGTIALTGAFDGARASGRMTLLDGRLKLPRRTLRCRDAGGPFELRDPGRPVGPAAPAPPGALVVGLSDDVVGGVRAPVVGRVGADGRRIRTLVARMDLRCDGAPASLDNYAPPITVTAAGAFGARESFRVRYRDAVDRYRVRTTGSFLAGGALQGSFRVSITTRYTKGPLKGRTQRCSRAARSPFWAVAV